MKVLVLEDEYPVLKDPFEYLNAKFYKGKLEIENISKTQDFRNFAKINEYDKIFVDISLHRNSEKDGFSFIRSLIGELTDLNKIVIVTGSDSASKKAKELGLGNITVLNKPITFLDLKAVMPPL